MQKKISNEVTKIRRIKSTRKRVDLNRKTFKTTNAKIKELKGEVIIGYLKASM